MHDAENILQSDTYVHFPDFLHPNQHFFNGAILEFKARAKIRTKNICMLQEAKF